MEWKIEERETEREEKNGDKAKMVQTEEEKCAQQQRNNREGGRKSIGT